MPIYNSYRLFEFTGYAFFYKQIIKGPFVKKIITWFLVLFPLYWFVTMFLVFDITEWVSYLPVLGNVFTVFFAAVYCYELFVSDDLTKFSKSPELWISLGLIIYYACNLPYEGMLNYLWQNYKPLAKQLVVLLNILNIVMYSMFVYSFLCRINMEKY